MAGHWSSIFLILVGVLDSTLVKAQNGCRADLCFVMDESGSIGRTDWQKSIQFVASFMSQLDVGVTTTQAGVVKFSSRASLSIPLNAHTSKDSLVNAILGLSYSSGGTNIHLGIQAARTQCFTTANGDRPQEYAPNILILMTDGRSSRSAAVAEANLARAAGITIIAIGIGGYELATLRAIADSQNVFTFLNFDALLQDVSQILGQSCQSVKDCDAGQSISITDEYPHIEKCPYLNDPELRDRTFIEFRCDIFYNASLVTSDARYRGSFLFDNKTDPGVPSIIISPPTTSFILDEQYLYLRLNKYISCQVESYYAVSPSTVSPAVRSRRYYAGIAPSKRLVYVNEGDLAPPDLYFFSSLPIPCEAVNSPASVLCSLSLTISSSSDRLLMYQPNASDFTQVRFCTFRLFQNDWKVNESLAYNIHSPLMLLAKRDSISSIPVTLTLNATANQVKLGQPKGAFSDYVMDSVRVVVIDQEPAVCKARGDPYMSTFDSGSKRSYAAMQQGYFMYVNSTARKFQIQARHFPCKQGGGAGCSVVCAVVVMEGKYVMSIERCNNNGLVNTLTLTTYGLDDNNSVGPDTVGNKGMEITTDPSRKEFMISTAGGAKVVADARRSRGLDLRITLSARDRGSTSGLCGTFDGDATNDLIPKGETIAVSASNHPERDRFIESWRLSMSSSLFYNQPSDKGSLDNIEDMFCHCGPKTTDRTSLPVSGDVCGLTALEDPIADIINPREHVRAQIPKYVLKAAKRRRRRQTGGVQLRSDDTTDFVPNVFVETIDNGVAPAWGTLGVTEVLARSTCLAVLDGNAVASNCLDLKPTVAYQDMLATCMEDIQRTGSLEWAAGRDKEFQQDCVAMTTTQNVTYRDSPMLQNLIAEADTLANAICPGACSGNGLCENSTCSCSPGFIGPDCSVPDRAPVLTSYLSDDVCNLENSLCRVVRLMAQYLANTPELTCKVTIIKPAGMTEMFFPGAQETAETVRCPLPDIGSVAATEGHYNYIVTVSNDALQYSSPLPNRRMVVDLSCLDCVNAICTQKSSTCIIDGNCFNDAEYDSQYVQACAICDASKNTKGRTIVGRHTWVTYPTTGSSSGESILTSTTPQLCQAKCVTIPACTTVDISSSGTCYSHTGTPAQISRSDVTQYVLTRCTTGQPTTTPSGCQIGWTTLADTHSSGGDFQARYNSLPSCQQGCVNQPSCLGFDLLVDQTNTKCWFHPVANENNFNNKLPESGATQYVLDRCVGDMTTSACKALYDVRGGISSPMGVNQPGISSLDRCKAACTALTDCVAIDLDTRQTPASCWIHNDVTDLVEQRGTLGITQYVLLDRCPGVCVNTWGSRPGYHGTGGTYHDAKPLSACQTVCVANASCVAVDFTTVDACFLFLSKDYGQEPLQDVTHYTLTRCDSGSVDTTTPTTTTATSSQTATPQVPGCQTGWTSSVNTHSSGGKFQASMTTTLMCQLSCIGQLSCLAIDVKDNSKCWFHQAETYSSSKSYEQGVTQYKLDRCVGKCNPTFNTKIDTSSPNGVSNSSVTTLEGCKVTCAENSSCLAIDYNTKNLPRCWLHSNQDDLDNPRSTPDVHQYILQDRCPGGCQIKWKSYTKSKSGGGMRESSLDTLAKCESGCLANVACIAIDYNAGTTSSDRCFFHSTPLPTRINAAAGVTQYVLDRCYTGCNISWKNRTRTKSTGASDRGAMDVSACLSICVDEPSCLAVDYDNAAGKCWTHTQADKLLATAQDSTVDQYILDRCASNETQKSNCSISWSKKTGTKSTGASDQGAIDVSACMSICVDEPSCLAVDYDKVAGICWTHTQADKLKTTVQDSSVDQYMLERCSSDPCPRFVGFGDQHASNGMPQTALTTKDSCQTGCLDNSNCDGFDFDTNHNGCYFFNQPTPNNTLAVLVGNTHYELVCRAFGIP